MKSSWCSSEGSLHQCSWWCDHTQQLLKCLARRCVGGPLKKEAVGCSIIFTPVNIRAWIFNNNIHIAMEIVSFPNNHSYVKFAQGGVPYVCTAPEGRTPHMDVSKNRGTQNGWWKEWNTLLKWMIWGYHYFWKHPYIPSFPLQALRISVFSMPGGAALATSQGRRSRKAKVKCGKTTLCI